jgi:hypothetical protein
MRKASTLVGLAVLTSVALAATARAQETASVVTTPEPARHRRIEVGVAFLPMSLGNLTQTPGGFETTVDAKLAPGVSVSAGYEVLVPNGLVPGVVVGIAPQVIWDVQWKEAPEGLDIHKYREDDFMARVAVGWTLAETVRLYLEVLPGYSRLVPVGFDGRNASGFVIAGGFGAAMSLGDRMFANLGGGIQKGYQKLPEEDLNAKNRTEFVRVTLGIGARF